MTMQTLFFDRALIGARMARDVRIEIGATGSIREVRTGVEPGDATRMAGVAAAAMPNLHSHAFQRAMAGRAERRRHARDSFWTWRAGMYELALRVAPEDVEAIAAQAYLEMLKAGYASVAEFHYIHHDRDGSLYKAPSAMSDAILAAAGETGVALTMLPALYQHANFGGERLKFEQRRFRSTIDEYIGLLDALKSRLETPDSRLGVAFHSLRAVDEAGIEEILSFRTMMDDSAPVHIHIAEQIKEVEDCIARSGARPIEWLYDHADVGPEWCLVHMTHASPMEQLRVAQSGAVAGLCPTTEANLGDGIFPFEDYVKAGGAFGIGSDSHASIAPLEELRWLEYVQRLLKRERAVSASDATPSPGAALWAAAASDGGRACGRNTGALESGARADLIVIDDQHAAVYGARDEDFFDALVFANIGGNAIRDVMVGGRWVIRDGRHPKEDAIKARFQKTLDRLYAA